MVAPAETRRAAPEFSLCCRTCPGLPARIHREALQGITGASAAIPLSPATVTRGTSGRPGPGRGHGGGPGRHDTGIIVLSREGSQRATRAPAARAPRVGRAPWSSGNPRAALWSKPMSGDDPSFLERLRAGEPRAFEELVIAYQHRVFGVALRMLGSRAEAEEGALLRAHRALGAFRGDAKLSTWLYAIASRLCLNRLASGERRLAREDPEALERRALDAHLAGCAECRRERERFHGTVALVRGLEPARAPAGFVDRVLAAARPLPRWRRFARALVFPLPVKLPLEAAAIVLVGVIVGLVYRQTPELRQAARGDEVTAPRVQAEPPAAPAPGKPTGAPTAQSYAAPEATLRDKGDTKNE